MSGSGHHSLIRRRAGLSFLGVESGERRVVPYKTRLMKNKQEEVIGSNWSHVGKEHFIQQTFCFVLNYIFITSLVGIYPVFSLNLYIIKTCTNIYPVWSIVVDTHRETHTNTHTYTHCKYCVQTAMFGSRRLFIFFLS